MFLALLSAFSRHFIVLATILTLFHMPIDLPSHSFFRLSILYSLFFKLTQYVIELHSFSCSFPISRSIIHASMNILHLYIDHDVTQWIILELFAPVLMTEILQHPWAAYQG